MNFEDLGADALITTWISRTCWYRGRLEWEIHYLPEYDDIVHYIIYTDKEGYSAFQTFPNKRAALDKWNDVEQVFSGGSLPKDLQDMIDLQKQGDTNESIRN